MSIAAVAALVQTLRKRPLLEPAQLDEVRRIMQVTFEDPSALVAELVRRGWLTAYQADLLLQGRIEELMLGSYILLEPLGEGGMGQVFKARQRKLGRNDAVKVIRAERLAAPNALRRFTREMIAAGQLSHPNVVHAYDAGQDGGRHYFVMELLAGVDLGQVVKRGGPLPFTEACEYARQAALGLQHAHERGLVHRDVKPTNLLLTNDGVVKVLDLGLARLTQHGESSDHALTETGAVMGTPDFIAPEQARQSHTVDGRADLYSLGATLYFLLTGRPPFGNRPMAAKIAAHLFEEPEALSVGRPGTPDSVQAVVRKLMAKNPDDRYPTAGEAAQALGRVMVELARGAEAPTGTWNREAIESPPPPPQPLPPARPAPRRPRWVAFAMAASVLVSACVVFAAVWIAMHGRRNPDPAAPTPPAKGELELQCADPDLYVIIRRKGDADPVGEVGTDPLALPPGDYEAALPSDAPAGLVLTLKEISLAPGGKQTIRVDGAPLAPWALVSRPAPIDGVLSWTITTRTGRGPVNRVAYSPDGRWLAAANEDGVVRLYDATTYRLDRALVGHFGAIHALAWSSDKTHPLLATADVRNLRIWEPSAGRLVRTLNVITPALAWAPDGKTIACAVGTDVELWDVETGRMAQQWESSSGVLDAVAWSPDGRWIAAAGEAGVLHLWKAPDGKGSLFKVDAGRIHALSWAPDNSVVAVACEDGTVHRQPVDGSAPPPPIKARDSRVNAVTWSPDSRYLAAGGDKSDFNARVFDAKTGAAVTTLGGPSFFANAVAWAPDGKTLAVGDWSRCVRFYDPYTAREVHRLDGHDDIPYQIAFSPDGTTFATDGQSGHAHVWNVLTGVRMREFSPLLSGFLNGLAWAPDGKRLAGGEGERAYLWGLVGPAKTVDLGPDSGHAHLAWSPDGALLATAPVGNAVRLSRTDGTGEPVVLVGHNEPVLALAWADDGTTLATGAEDGATTLWDRDGAAWKPRDLTGRQGKVHALQWSPDGTVLATAGDDGTVCLWDRASGKNLQTLHASSVAVRSVAWRDAQTLITVSNGGAERFWDAGTGDLKKTIHRGRSFGVVFSPDARLNAAGSAACTARLWDTDTGRPLGTVVLLRQGWLVLSEDGHYRAQSEKVANELVYVAQTEAGQQTLTPEEFVDKYKWKNDRSRARLDTR